MTFHCISIFVGLTCSLTLTLIHFPIRLVYIGLHSITFYLTLYSFPLLYSHSCKLHFISCHFYCVPLRSIAFHCITCCAMLHITWEYVQTLHFITLQYLPLHCITLHCIAWHCVALHYITYIHVRSSYIHISVTLHCITLHWHDSALHCIALRCIASVTSIHKYMCENHVNISSIHKYMCENHVNISCQYTIQYNTI
jgi:hypothetical protein